MDFRSWLFIIDQFHSVGQRIKQNNKKTIATWWHNVQQNVKGLLKFIYRAWWKKNNRNIIADQFCCRTVFSFWVGWGGGGVVLPPPANNLLTHSQKHPHAHTEPSGSCLRGGQIKYLFTLSGERLDRAPLILSLWEPLLPWITLSLGAPRQTSGHAPLRSMPRHRPHHPTTSPEPPPPPPPSLTHPCTTGGGGGTRDREWMREIKREEREGTGRDGGNRGQTETRKDDRRNTLVIHSVLVLKGKIYTYPEALFLPKNTKNTPCCSSPPKNTIHLTLCSAVFHHRWRCIYGHSKFLHSWKIGTSLAHWWMQKHRPLNRKRLESKNYEAALLLGSPGMPVAWGW